MTRAQEYFLYRNRQCHLRHPNNYAVSKCLDHMMMTSVNHDCLVRDLNEQEVRIVNTRMYWRVSRMLTSLHAQCDF